jgi:hypothetical protein
MTKSGKIQVQVAWEMTAYAWHWGTWTQEQRASQGQKETIDVLRAVHISRVNYDILILAGQFQEEPAFFRVPSYVTEASLAYSKDVVDSIDFPNVKPEEIYAVATSGTVRPGWGTGPKQSP